MASEAPAPTTEAAAQSAEPAAPSKKFAMIAALAIAGTGVGAAAGAFVVAPKLIARQAAAGADTTHAEPESGGEEHGEGKGEKKVIRIDNVIVNPAGTGGTRYLMASFGLEVGDPEAEKRITEHEIEVRDRITSILEAQTLASLTASWARDSVKLKVTESLREIAGPKTSLRVFVPQFVIQ